MPKLPERRHDPEWYTAKAWLMRRRFQLADTLVHTANLLIREWTNQTPAVYPRYRPVDTYMPGIGHQHSCGAYSYEELKTLTEQDGPDGFGATATVKWLIGEEGWVSFDNMPLADIKAVFAADGHFGLSPPHDKP